MVGVVYYLIGSVQGSVETLHRFQQLTHFNDFVVGHARLTVFGAMIMWVLAGLPISVQAFRTRQSSGVFLHLLAGGVGSSGRSAVGHPVWGEMNLPPAECPAVKPLI